MSTTPAIAATARTEVLGTRAAVTSSSPLISLAGARVLADGGNAVDATLAMAAMGWMVLPGQCGVGGDAFAVVREPDGRVWTVNGSGFGPDGGTVGFYRDQGLTALPMTGAQAVTVPGAPAALATLQGYASRSLADLWRPAVQAARDGIACTAKNRADIAEYALELSADPSAREVFLSRGAPPQVGDRLVQRDLADFLETLAGDPTAFYTGSFAERAVAFLTAAGAPFSGDEWAAAAAPAMPAVSVPYGDAVLHQTPMPSAGWMVLQQAAICDGALRAGVEQLDATSVHWLASAAMQAFRDRFDVCGADTETWRDVLSADAVGRARRSIMSGLPEPTERIGVHGDTTSTVCVDAEGRAVSFIHSLGFTFGARRVVPGTGVVLNNRLGRGAYLIDAHPNAVQPRRKPLHTLNAWLLDHPDRGLLHAGNCPGGDGQVQWNMQVLSHLVDHGDDPQRAVSLPRFTVFPGSDADTIGRPAELRCEPGFPQGTLDTLSAWGHAVRRVPLQTGGPGGSALAISLDQGRGILRAAADPRMEGVALAL